MKTLIWIIVLALVAWGIYALVNRDDTGTTVPLTTTEEKLE